MHRYLNFILFATLLLTTLSAMPNEPNQTFAQQTKTPVQLAVVYNHQAIDQYLISEKFDGIRAIWKDGHLRTRSGSKIHAPAWFTEKFPKAWLDGELWIRRGAFEKTLSIISKKTPNSADWRDITFMVFDSPNYSQTFEQRFANYKQLLQKLDLTQLKAVKQIKVDNKNQLYAMLEKIESDGGEGLMLHRADAHFISGRSGNLLKLKTYFDGEAKILAYVQGKGKYRHALGAILVEYKNKNGDIIRFKIGSGFSDLERKDPPKIGSFIHFRYAGYTKNGIPKFASYVRPVATTNVNRR